MKTKKFTKKRSIQSFLRKMLFLQILKFYCIAGSPTSTGPLTYKSMPSSEFPSPYESTMQNMGNNPRISSLRENNLESLSSEGDETNPTTDINSAIHKVATDAYQIFSHEYKKIKVPKDTKNLRYNLQSVIDVNNLLESLSIQREKFYKFLSSQIETSFIYLQQLEIHHYIEKYREKFLEKSEFDLRKFYDSITKEINKIHKETTKNVAETPKCNFKALLRNPLTKPTTNTNSHNELSGLHLVKLVLKLKLNNEYPDLLNESDKKSDSQLETSISDIFEKIVYRNRICKEIHESLLHVVSTYTERIEEYLSSTDETNTMIENNFKAISEPLRRLHQKYENFKDFDVVIKDIKKSDMEKILTKKTLQEDYLSFKREQSEKPVKEIEIEINKEISILLKLKNPELFVKTINLLESKEYKKEDLDNNLKAIIENLKGFINFLDENISFDKKFFEAENRFYATFVKNKNLEKINHVKDKVRNDLELNYGKLGSYKVDTLIENYDGMTKYKQEINKMVMDLENFLNARDKANEFEKAFAEVKMGVKTVLERAQSNLSKWTEIIWKALEIRMEVAIQNKESIFACLKDIWIWMNSEWILSR